MITTTLDLDAIKARTDLRQLAARDTALRHHAGARNTPAEELCGPCPICHAGRDRFFVGRDLFCCRICGAGGDAIRYIMLTRRVDFLEAVQMLAPDAAPIARPPVQPSPPPAQSASWIARCAPLLAAWAAALFATDNPGAAYLTARGLTPATWRAFGLGYCAERNAIAMPWLKRGVLWGIRYRLLRPAPDGPKVISETDSIFSGLLFGGQTMALPPDSRLLAQRSLFVVEGEINAMSVWQIASSAYCDVLSLGSESARLPDSLCAIAARYRARIVWMDKEAYARRNARQLDAAAYWSQVGDDLATKRDANDLLRSGALAPLLAELLRRATHAEHQEALSYDLFDAGLV